MISHQANVAMHTYIPPDEMWLTIIPTLGILRQAPRFHYHIINMYRAIWYLTLPLSKLNNLTYDCISIVSLLIEPIGFEQLVLRSHAASRNT